MTGHRSIEFKKVVVFLLNHAIRLVQNTSSYVRVAIFRHRTTLLLESLILAQSERWRHG